MVVTTRQRAAASAKVMRERESYRRERCQPGTMLACSAYMEIQRDVYFRCGICYDVDFGGDIRRGHKVHENDLEEHTKSYLHFLCTMHHLVRLDSDVARLEVIGRWLEKMPGLRTQWGIYCSRRRYMLEMEAITEEMLQPGTALERLLVREVRTYPFDTKAAFVARVAFYLDLGVGGL